jgi:hypothetical protein
MNWNLAELVRRPRVWAIVVAGIAACGASVAALNQAQPKAVTIDVYKTPTCGCCSKWVDHLKAAGFTVKTTDLDNLDDIKAKYGVPTDLGSCHTAVADGYVIEGHVPAADVSRMLKERPQIAGIAVPAMPAGSPGMEVPSGRVQPYRVIAFEKNGKTSVYNSYNGTR